MGRIFTLLPCLFLCYLPLSTSADDHFCQGTACGSAVSWTEVDETNESLAMLQIGAAKVEPMLKDDGVEILAPPSDKCPLPSGARWCQASSGDKSWMMAVYSDTDDKYISTTICEAGFWEFKDLWQLGIPERPSERRVLLDIGANIGWYTFMFAAHGHKAIAIEPMAQNLALMKATLCANPDLAARTHVFAKALTDVAAPGQSCSMFSVQGNSGDGVLACSEDQAASLLRDPNLHYIKRDEVPLTTLDSLITFHSDKVGERIDVVKMDVEGHECNVLAGASQLFDLHPQYLMIEAKLPSSPMDTESINFDCVVSNMTSHGSYGMHYGSFRGKRISYEESMSSLQGINNIFFSL